MEAAENFQNCTTFGENEIYPNHSLEREMSNFIKVCIAVATSLSYCKFTSKIVPKGLPRLLTFLPIIPLFLYLPLNLHSVHLCGITAFFISWLSSFKILLLAFDKGPLSDPAPSLSLPKFLAVGCFPIKIQPNLPPNSQTKQINSNKSPWSWNYYVFYSVKVLLVAAILHIYNYHSQHNYNIHPKLILVIYCFHLYIFIRIMFATSAALARAVAVGSSLEPQFDEPYLSTSLQNFWGRRWNIAVTTILRPAVYEPALRASARYFLARKWAPIPAAFVTFVVSGVMHELMFYYLSRSRPTWEMMVFFLLHGVGVAGEIWVKKVLKGRWKLTPVVSRPLTIGFVVVTSLSLYPSGLLRSKAFVRASDEYLLVLAFVKDIIGL